MKRRPRLYGSLAAALFVVMYLLAPLLQGQRGAIATLLGVSIPALYTLLCLAIAGALEAADERWPRRMWSKRVLLILGGIALALVPMLWLRSVDGRNFVMRPSFALFVLGNSMTIIGLFSLISEAVDQLARRARSVSWRLMTVALLSAGFGAIIGSVAADQFEVMKSYSSAVAILVTAAATVPIAWGFARSMSIPLKRSLNGIAGALQRVRGGDLTARVEVAGRDEVAQIGTAFNQMVGELKEKEFLERAFGQYVTAPVLAALRQDGGLTLKSQRREATVLYADIRGFTTLSETASPEEVMALLNTYFGRMLQAVERHQGYVNKFIGDALMVVFNAPLEQPDHAARGVSCARALQQELEALNAANAFGEGRRIAIGVGVNTGPVVAGSLGGEHRAEYTVIGDAVNVAARLTSNAKAGEILVGATTAKASAAAALEAVPPLTVKGKSAPLEVFRVAG